MSAGSKKVTKAPKTADAITLKAIADADIFVQSSRDRTAIEKLRDAAKQSLFDWLGQAATKTLPDGRAITRLSTPIAEEASPRKGFDRVTLVVSPPPAAA